ncbi:metallophosphoesterase [Motiliproteus sp. SC1-56]|uniref:metallophosphoesterase n=1 Tax=Motiliproteus sp. SC1-56 TaxID=2799565 RepID=UPI001A8E9370|nr:metallophosphoesterase [Motiliproteus sp. SC1-56]
MDQQTQSRLEQRIGRQHLRQRLGIESTPQRIFGGGLNLFHLENWHQVQRLIRGSLRLVGLYHRGYRNAARYRVVRRDIFIPGLPEAFQGYTLLHLSDLHLDMNPEATEALLERVEQLTCDLCVLTGDYRAQTAGAIDPAMNALQRLSARITGPTLAVLGNHDSLSMVPAMEAMGIRVLLNEAHVISRGEAQLYLAGVDDAHYYRADNLHRAAEAVPEEAVSILLSHTPEIYRQAAHAGFDLMLCGHTHGGQICLPGGTPLLVEAHCPRRYCKGGWQYLQMKGYTSVGCGTSVAPVRFNCPPEVTLHRLLPQP